MRIFRSSTPPDTGRLISYNRSGSQPGQSSAIEASVLNQIVRDPVDDRSVNDRRHAGKLESRDSLFFNDNCVDFDPVIDLSSQARAVLK